MVPGIYTNCHEYDAFVNRVALYSPIQYPGEKKKERVSASDPHSPWSDVRPIFAYIDIRPELARDGVALSLLEPSFPSALEVGSGLCWISTVPGKTRVAGPVSGGASSTSSPPGSL